MRLPVILVQQAPAGGQSLAEDLVGELIGRAGLDLTLVDRFESIRPESSDKLTLDGITVPSAVLDWRPAEELYQTLQTLSFDGARCAHELDRDAPASNASGSRRRLFLFDLRSVTSAKAVIAELDRLRESLSVKTFSLGSIGAPEKTPARPAPVPVVPAKPSSNSSSAPPAKPTGDDDALDALIDQLDELDV